MPLLGSLWASEEKSQSPGRGSSISTTVAGALKSLSTSDLHTETGKVTLHGQKEGGDAARIAELEAELAEEKRRSDQKEDELFAMQKLLAKLENAIEQQAKDAQLEQDRIGLLEKSLADRHGNDEQTVEKLLLAVAGEKQLKDAAEKTNLMLEAKNQDLEAKLKKAEEMQKKNEEERSKAVSMAGEAQAMEAQLRVKLAAEEAKRRTAEDLALQKETQLAELRSKLEAAGKSGVLSGRVAGAASPRTSAGLMVIKEGVQSGAEVAKTGEIIALQMQLEEESVKRRVAEQKLADFITKHAGGDSQAQTGLALDIRRDADVRELRSLNISREREVLDLQRQLAEELSKLRTAQYQNIEKERICLEKDRLIAQLQEQLHMERESKLAAGFSNPGSEQASVLDEPQYGYSRASICDSEGSQLALPSSATSSSMLSPKPGHKEVSQQAMVQWNMVGSKSVRPSQVGSVLSATTARGGDDSLGSSLIVSRENTSHGTASAASRVSSFVATGMNAVPVAAAQPAQGERTSGGEVIVMGAAVSARPSGTPGQLVETIQQQQNGGFVRQRAYLVPAWMNLAAQPGQEQPQASMVTRRLAMASRTFA